LLMALLRRVRQHHRPAQLQLRSTRLNSFVLINLPIWKMVVRPPIV